MRARQVKNPDITYTDECTNAYSGQQNFTACIYVDKEIVGCVEYVLYSGELTVSDIQVKPEYKRMGYGSRLMKYIKEENPRYNYISSMKTEDGTAFVHKDINLYEFEQGGDPYEISGLGKWNPDNYSDGEIIVEVKAVKESINEFEQGLDPYKAMNIGPNRPYKDGEIVICKEDLWLNKNYTTYTTVPHYHNKPLFMKDVEYCVTAGLPGGYNQYKDKYDINKWGFKQEEIDDHFERK
jgi:GNAT superfamily N-acetyltransferase